ncbi:O-acyltransferase like protein [Aethina tumida]|uniref:O-acyltransferase like protein n=1 Tax=Aethina tumida TaxID=116153 RepID=UPI0021484A3E|nr:O-acyltransferase like protein [Aethina tumida]
MKCSTRISSNNKMLLFCTVIVIIVGISLEVKSDLIPDDIYDEFPPIFHIDDQNKCHQENKHFCRVSLKLNPINESSEIWKSILKTKENINYYNHDELFYAICVEDACPQYQIEPNHIGDVIRKCYSKKHQHLGLDTKVVDYNCKDHIYEIGNYEIIFMCSFGLYMSLVLFATYYDYKHGKHKTVKFGMDIIKSLSIVTNWEKIKKINEQPKLRCMQGIRFYTMLLVIFCHTYASFIGGYVQDTKYLEQIYLNPLRHMLNNWLVFLVQTFFLFSAWLLSYHFFQTLEKSSVSLKRYVTLTFINRYLRIIPPVFLITTFGYSTWIFNFLYNGPVKDQYSDLEYKICQKNWWTTLLFINNISTEPEMCYFITWYLSADTQLYLLSLLIFSVIWKFRNRAFSIISIFIVVGMAIPGIVGYIFDLDIIFRISPENSKLNNFRTFLFNATYTSTYSNMATYMIGLMFGYIYYKCRQRRIFDNKIKKLLWWILFLGLPIMVVRITCYQYSRLTSALLIVILRPLYSIGIGVGILGMSEKIGGYAQSVCEWRPAIFMGNFTYSTYVVHYVYVFYRTATATKPLVVSDGILLRSFLIDATMSFFLGFLMHILIELPASQLQKLFVPQVKKNKVLNKIE